MLEADTIDKFVKAGKFILQMESWMKEGILAASRAHDAIFHTYIYHQIKETHQQLMHDDIYRFGLYDDLSYEERVTRLADSIRDHVQEWGHILEQLRLAKY